jgi:uncharacterized protein (TIGR00730 family)
LVISEIRSVAVFCGSRSGNDPACRTAALALGRGLAEAGITLVYGGGRIGLMGAVADGAIEGGGRVIGVIPEFLTRREVAHPGVPDLEVTDSMHSRKQRMFALADAFVALPGGLGTLDELVEIITWRQLGLHDKPILICDVSPPGREVQGGATGAQAFLRLVEAVIAAGFADASARRLFELAEGVPALLTRLHALGRSPATSVERL